MKAALKNIWAKLSSSQKMNLIGSGLLIFSLFLNWFSDKDVFRSGDVYSGLNGPLYLVGLTLLVLALGNVAVTLMMAAKAPFLKNLGTIKLGRWQMMFSFGAMYLLVLTNSVYFSPLFGLNILNKKSEIGTMVALAAIVMICIGGYLAFRKKFEVLEAKAEVAAAVLARERTVETIRKHAGVAVKEEVVTAETERVLEAAVGRAEVVERRDAVPVEAAAAVNTVVNAPAYESEAANSYFSERDPRGKTDFERNKLYDNLRKTMLRDTMTPQQRKQERTNEVGESAFSANFGKNAKGKAVATVGEMTAKALGNAEKEVVTAGATSKKPQMYRLDL